MKKNRKNMKLIITVLVVFALFAGCNEFDEPEVINITGQEFGSDPVISEIIPADSALAGIRELVIRGSNFATGGADTTWVYIGGEAAAPKSLSSTEIVVDRPSLYGDDIAISVVVPTALSVAQVNSYGIEMPVEEWGDFSYENYDLTSMEVGPDETIYVATRRKIITLASDGVTINTLGEYPSAFANITSLKFGPDGYLYALVGKKDLYRIDISTGLEENFARIPKNTTQMDFDENGNIYCARKDGIYLVKPDQSVSETGKLDDMTLEEMRVFNGYLYAAESKALYKLEILDSNGSLGDPVTILDINDMEGFLTCDITSFSIDINGTIFICVIQHARYSIFVLEDNGELTPYYEKDILPRSVDKLIWGNDRYLYLNRGLSLDRDSLRLYRMGMATEGAPYSGRNF